MAQILAPRTEPEVIHASEDRALAVWQELYPDHWLYHAACPPTHAGD